MFSLHHPSVREIFEIRADRTTGESIRSIISAMNALPRNLTAEVVVVIARKLHPALPDSHALAELQLSIDDAAAEIRCFTMLADKVAREEIKRLEPLVFKVMARKREIMGKIPGLKSSIESAAKAAADKIQILTKAGVSPDEAIRATGDYGEAENRAVLASISAEIGPLEKFLRNFDEADLPAGFIQPAAAPTSEHGNA